MMETSVFPISTVVEEMQGFVELQMHYDHYVDDLREKANELQIRLLNTIGAPMFVVLNPDTEEILSEVGYSSEERFLEFLREAKGK